MRKTYLLLMAILCTTLVACHKQNKGQVRVDLAPRETNISSEENFQVVGVESSDAYELLLTNSTGKDIKELSIKSSEKTEYPANMIKSGEVISADELVKLFYTPEENVMVQNEDTDKSLNVIYELKVVLSDETTYYLSSFGIGDIKDEVEIFLEDEVLYTTYISKNANAVVSTKEQEIGAMQLRKEEARAKAEAEAKAQAEAKAKAEAEAKAQAEAKAKAEAEAKAQAETKAKAEAEAKAQAEASASAQLETQYQVESETVPEQYTDSCLGGAALN